MKTFGGYSFLILTALCALIGSLYYYMDQHVSAGAVWLAWLGFTLICFKMVRVSGTAIKVFRPLWFLHQRNAIPIGEIGSIDIHIGGFSELIFYSKTGAVMETWHTQLYKFEVKRLERALQELGIETSRSGTGAWDYFD